MSTLTTFLSPTKWKFITLAILMAIIILGFNMVGDPIVPLLQIIAAPIALGYLLLFGIFINPLTFVMPPSLLFPLHTVLGLIYLYVWACVISLLFTKVRVVKNMGRRQ